MASTLSLADQLTESVFAYQLIEAARLRLLRELRGLVNQAHQSGIEGRSLTRARLILLTREEAIEPTIKDLGRKRARIVVE